VRVALAAALLAAAVAAGALLLREGGGASSEEIAALRARVDEERAARDRLEAQLARLEGEVASLREGGAVLDEAAVAPYEAAPSEAEPSELAAQAAEAPSPSHAWFDARRLAGAGLAERDVAELRELFEDVELDRLYLQNQAKRERWAQGRLGTELAALDQRLLSVRGDYGEETYDWFLFASGHPNRVVVEGVLGGSAAAEAGLQNGDAIVGYAGERIYRPEALIRGTVGGSLNETVEVEIERGGSRSTLTLPRGPLGIRLGQRTAQPAPVR
jgi:hypothetical protein